MIISSTMYKRNVKTRAWRKLSNNDTLESVTVLLWILSARAREAQICNTQVGEKHTVWTRMLDYTLLTTPSPQPCFLGNQYKLYSNKSWILLTSLFPVCIVIHTCIRVSFRKGNWHSNSEYFDTCFLSVSTARSACIVEVFWCYGWIIFLTLKE